MVAVASVRRSLFEAPMIYCPLIACLLRDEVTLPCRLIASGRALLLVPLYHNNRQLRDLIASYYYIGLRCLSSVQSVSLAIYMYAGV